MNIVLFGPPGAGKGTQSALLVSQKKMHHISTGDLFRSHIKSKTPLGLRAKEYLDSGRLMPDDVTLSMVKEALAMLHGEGVVLDGFPRNVAQADALETLGREVGFDVEKAVFFDVPEAVLVGRLSGRWTCRNCGAVYHEVNTPPKVAGVCDRCQSKDLYQRADDSLESIKTRLKIYQETTAPLRDYYQARGRLAAVDGQGPTEQVYDRLCRVLWEKK
jgi:adenylate kinase